MRLATFSFGSRIRKIIREMTFAVLLLTFLTATAQAGLLKGTVLGKAGDPKRFVRITIVGPETRTTFTNRNGTFSLEARDGRYRLIISEKGNKQEFEVDIPGTKELHVNW